MHLGQMNASTTLAEYVFAVFCIRCVVCISVNFRMLITFFQIRQSKRFEEWERMATEGLRSKRICQLLRSTGKIQASPQPFL